MGVPGRLQCVLPRDRGHVDQVVRSPGVRPVRLVADDLRRADLLRDPGDAGHPLLQPPRVRGRLLDALDVRPGQ